ncbi:unnamed protein product [Dracunculus medinensis]|uniref:DUF3453 domain-containing protein n=1 Tax=Dracunculus medinensis TaxID=318479 RepID=A0A0N4URW9_DRAME|nr:unnamed protein product [Dracunculus medinensis]
MIRDSNDDSNDAEAKNRLIKCKEFFEAKVNYDTPFIVSNIAGLLIEPYVCNYKSTAEVQIISVIHKLKAKKTSGKDGLRTLQIFSIIVHNSPSTNSSPLVWQKEITPKDWSKAILLPIPRKDDRTSLR